MSIVFRTVIQRLEILFVIVLLCEGGVTPRQKKILAKKKKTGIEGALIIFIYLVKVMREKRKSDKYLILPSKTHGGVGDKIFMRQKKQRRCGWQSVTIVQSIFPQIFFGNLTRVTALKLRSPSEDDYNYVTEFQLQYSEEGSLWIDIRENDTAKVSCSHWAQIIATLKFRFPSHIFI